MSQATPSLLTADQLGRMIRERPDVRVLDVRTPGEFETAHIAGAYNVPVDNLSEHAREIQAHVGEPVVLICQSGGRASRAREVLATAGMPDLHVLEGGMNAWLSDGRAVVRRVKRMSLERQVRIAAGSLAATGAALALLVHPWFAGLPLFVGSGLVFAGVTDTCAMGMLLARLPYNRAATCDVGAMVQALKTGTPAGGPGSPMASGAGAA